MSAPRWAVALLRWLAPTGGVEDVLGDLEEAHGNRVQHHGRLTASVLTGAEALDLAAALFRERIRRRRMRGRSTGSEGTMSDRMRPDGRFSGARVSLLDFKLGFRMLGRYPGLTLVGGLAMAFAIWVGAGTFEFLTQVVYPTLPLDEGDRIVAIRLWNAAESEEEPRALHDFVVWREELRSVQELGAYRTLERNLITEEGSGEPVEVAEMSASGFRVARVPPLLGRSLLPVDEAPGAPPVVVLGYDLWQRRFEGDPDVVGQDVRLGRDRATVVGVMPEGFGFPVAHTVWTPLRLNALDYERGKGPTIQVFGRLAPGTSLDEAQAELTALVLRAATAFPETHEHLRPQVMPYANSVIDLPGWATLGLMSINGFIVMLLILVCGNVALLMFARAATRASEIVIRNALGASRARIVAQLFAEALVLSAVAAAVGLAAVSFGLRWGTSMIKADLLNGGSLPFWFHDTLSAGSVVYAIALTILAALVAGVMPALKMTGRDLEGHLRRGTAGGGGPRFGGVWTAVIVTQVAFTTFFPVITLYVQRDMARIRAHEVGFPAEEYLAVLLELDQDEPANIFGDSAGAELRARARASVLELERRLAADPGVAGVTFASELPGATHTWRRVEVDGGGAASIRSPPGYRARVASVAVDFFDVLGTPILSGRGFDAGDVESGQPVVIVNRSFVDRVLGGRNPIGRRVRYLPGEPQGARAPGNEPGPWYEIVGVVNDLMTDGASSLMGGFYHPVAPAAARVVRMVVHVRGDAESFAPRLRALATTVNPMLLLHRPTPLDEINRSSLQFYAFWTGLSGLMTAVALVLSWAGIYAVMSFTVSRRTREIGVRVALGGDARRIILAIFRRPLAQVTIGVVAGASLILASPIVGLGVATSGPRPGPTPGELAMLGAYATLMFGVCMLACIVPTRRALRVEPTEALKADG